MRDLLRRLAQNFDYIILDAPPLLPVTDAAVLVPAVDAAILVTRAKKTRRDELREALTVMETARGRVAGLVFNCGAAPTADRYGPYVHDVAQPTMRDTIGDRALPADGRAMRRGNPPVSGDRAVPPTRG
jgi:Mrp family chromosome partitioning ATPase